MILLLMEIAYSDVRISKIISGSENYHAKLRQEICRKMITKARIRMGWYLNQVHSTTPSKYLRNSNMTVDGVWGGEICRVNDNLKYLGTDVYVANYYNQTITSIFSEVHPYDHFILTTLSCKEIVRKNSFDCRNIFRTEILV